MENKEHNNFAELGNELEEGYNVPFHKRPGFWGRAISAVAGIIFIIFLVQECNSSISPEELKASLKVESQSSRWVNKRVTPYEVTIVPSISFKVQNIGKKDIKSLKFTAVFQFLDSNEQLGDGFTLPLKRVLKPGDLSIDVTMNSNHGYKASSKEAFLKNIEAWKKVRVKIFAKTNSSPVHIGTFPIKQEIEGINVNLSEEEKAAQKAKEDKALKLAKSIQLNKIKGNWEYKHASSSRIVIVPAINFELKNVGATPLHNIILRASFIHESNGSEFTAGGLIALKNPLSPGQQSSLITVKGEFGYSQSSIEELQKNKNNIAKLKVRVYAKTRNSSEVHLGTYTVERLVKAKKN